MKIQATRDYKQFKTVPGNRPVEINHVNYLVKLNSKNNLLWQYPGSVTKDGYLTDGQHRLAAAEANEWDFYYTIGDQTLEELGDTIVATINTAQRGWKPINYIKFYAAHKKEQYAFLLDLMQEYHFSHAVILKLVTGKPSEASLKRGELHFFETAEDKQVIEDIVKEYAKLRGTVAAVILSHTMFAAAMRTVFKYFSAEDLEIAFARTPIRLEPQRGTKDYLRNLEEILNYKKHEKNYTRFF